jgi:Tannase and feruloyl esterase
MLAAVSTGLSAQGVTLSHASCRGLSNLRLLGAKIDRADVISDGTFEPAPVVGSPSRNGSAITNLPIFCRVQGVAKPSEASEVKFEVWLPIASWDGRIEMIGNGGYSSAIFYPEMASLLRGGRIAVATNTGHTGDGLEFGVDNPQAIADWGHRAVHASIVAAKKVAESFYGKAPRWAYFDGCSTGGHQALMEAQRYPADFDGILAGDPGNDRTNLNFGFLWNFLSNHKYGDDDNPILSPADLSFVNHAVVNKCDALDGVQDGIISDPRECHFELGNLECRAGQTSQCLTKEKILALQKIYAGATRSDNGKVVYPGWPLGSEYLETNGRSTGWQTYWANPEHPDQPQRVDYFRFWAFADPAWNWWKFDWSDGVDKAHAKLGPMVDAVDPDLSAFHRHGGKLIIYQGWADPVVSAYDTISYYERVEKDNKESASFTRLFLVPGMGHCQGGPGVTNFGQVPSPTNASAHSNAADNIGDALLAWVEQNRSPDRIIATKAGTSGAILMSRPICAWPNAAHYKGKGSTNDAKNFVCRKTGA